MHDVEIVRTSDHSKLLIARAGWLAGYKATTRSSYSDGLDQWFYWCAANNIEPLQAERPHVALWGRYLEEVRELKPATVGHRLCILRSFYRYCEDEDFIIKSPAHRVPLPKVSSESQTQGMTRIEVGRLIAASERRASYHALVCLLTLNGLRVSEACSAKIEDLSIDRGHRTLVVMRKGGAAQKIPLSARTARAIDAAVGARTSGCIITSLTDEPMTRFTAASVVARLGKQAKLPYHVHPHMLRHAFATIALDAGAALHDVQDSMNHANPSTTMRYNRNRYSLDRNVTHLVSAFITVR